MTAALSIFFKWQKMWNKGGHNFNFISEWEGTAPKPPHSYRPDAPEHQTVSILCVVLTWSLHFYDVHHRTVTLESMIFVPPIRVKG